LHVLYNKLHFIENKHHLNKGLFEGRSFATRLSMVRLYLSNPACIAANQQAEFAVAVRP
jgi:hypothetical protein